MKIKKLSINVLCGAIIITLAVSLMMPIYKLGYNFGAGLRMGAEDARHNIGNTAYTQSVDVYFEPSPDVMLSPRDSIYFANGKNYPMIMTRGTVTVERDRSLIPGWIPLVQGFCVLLQGIFFILMLYQFVKFVININKGKIFVADNVRRLRKIAMWLILLALFVTVAGLTEEIAVGNLGLILEGYVVSAYWSIPWETFIMGLVALVVAEAWDRGIKMQELQDFTI